MNKKKLVVFFFLSLLAMSLNNNVSLATNPISQADNTIVNYISPTQVNITPNAISGNGAGKYALSIYNQFLLPDGTKATMILPGGVKYYINRCDNNPFNIYGNLESRLGNANGNIGGHLIFISPKGIVVGPNAIINTGSLTLSTAASTKIKGQDGNYLKDSNGNDIDLNSVSSTEFVKLYLDPTNVIEYGSISASNAKIINQGVINTYKAVDNSETTSVDFIAGSIINNGTIGGDGTSIVNFSRDQNTGKGVSLLNSTDSINLIVADKATYSNGTYETNEVVAASDAENAMGSVSLGQNSVTQANHITINTLSNNPVAKKGESSLLAKTAVNVEGRINAYSSADGVQSGIIDITAKSNDSLNHSIAINGDNSSLKASGESAKINLTSNSIDINLTGTDSAKIKSEGNVNINAQDGSANIAGNNAIAAVNDVNINATETHINSFVDGLTTVTSGNDINITTNGSTIVSGYSTLKSGNDVKISAAEAHIGSTGTDSSTIDSAGYTNITTSGAAIITGNKAIKADKDVNITGHQVDIGLSGSNMQTVYSKGDINITANDTASASSTIYGDNTLRADKDVNITAKNFSTKSEGNKYTSTDFGALTDEPAISAGENINIISGRASITGHSYLKSDNGDINITSNTANASIKFDALRDSTNNAISYAPVLKAKNINIDSKNGDVQVLDRTKFIADNKINITGKTGVQIKNTTMEATISGATHYPAGGLAMYTLPTGSINISSSQGLVSISAQNGAKALMDSGNIAINSNTYTSLSTDVSSRINLKAANDIDINANDIYLANYSYLEGENINLTSNNSTYLTNYFHLPLAKGFGSQTDNPLIKAHDSINILSNGNIFLRGNNYLLAGTDADAAGKISIRGKNLVFEPDSLSTFCDYSILKGKAINLTGNNIDISGRSKFIATDGPIALIANKNITLSNSQFEYSNYNPGAQPGTDSYNAGLMDYTGLTFWAQGQNGNINLISEGGGNINILTSSDENNLSPVMVSLLSENNTIRMKSHNINGVYTRYQVKDRITQAEGKYLSVTTDTFNNFMTQSTISSTAAADKPVAVNAPKDKGSSSVAQDNNSTPFVAEEKADKPAANKSDNNSNEESSTNKIADQNSKDENTDIKTDKNEKAAVREIQQNTISIKGKKIDNFYGDSFMNSLVKNNSKENEFRADLNAVKESAQMGYHPAGIAGFLISVKSLEDSPNAPKQSAVNSSFVYRHPVTTDRLGKIEGGIRELSKDELHAASLINSQEFTDVMSVLKR